MSTMSTSTKNHQVGETKTIKGRTYRLNDNFRWENTDLDEIKATIAKRVSPGDKYRGSGDSADIHDDRGNANQAEASPDDLKAHATSASTKITNPKLANLLNELRAKDTGKGLFRTTPKTSDANKHAIGDLLFAALQGKADGPKVDMGNGKFAPSHKAFGGLVVDLGGGRIGFSSEAGAIVLGAPKRDPATGVKIRTITYTHNTGVVKRAVAASRADTAIGKASDTTIQKQESQAEPPEPPVQTPEQATEAPEMSPVSPAVSDAIVEATETLAEPSPAVKDAIHEVAVKLHDSAKPLSPKVNDAIKKTAKTLKKAATKPAKPKKATKPKKLSQWKQTVHDQATAWGMPPEEYEKIVTELHREHAEVSGMREAAKQHARKVTGLTAADINRLENQGYDHGSNVDETKGLDDIGRSLAAMYPSLGWGRGYDGEGGDDTDYGELLWNILREGKQPVPSKRSPEFLTHVDDFLNSQMNSHGPVGTYDSHGSEEMTPFFKQGGLRIRYSKWVEISSRSKLNCPHG